MLAPTSGRVLIPPASSAHRRAPSPHRTRRRAVALTPVARRTDRHIPATPGAAEAPKLLSNPRAQWMHTGQASPSPARLPSAAPSRRWRRPRGRPASLCPLGLRFAGSPCLISLGSQSRLPTWRRPGSRSAETGSGPNQIRGKSGEQRAGSLRASTTGSFLESAEVCQPRLLAYQFTSAIRKRDRSHDQHR